jgi:hypothetical protein
MLDFLMSIPFLPAARNSKWLRNRRDPQSRIMSLKDIERNLGDSYREFTGRLPTGAYHTRDATGSYQGAVYPANYEKPRGRVGDGRNNPPNQLPYTKTKQNQRGRNRRK